MSRGPSDIAAAVSLVDELLGVGAVFAVDEEAAVSVERDEIADIDVDEAADVESP